MSERSASGGAKAAVLLAVTAVLLAVAMGVLVSEVTTNSALQVRDASFVARIAAARTRTATALLIGVTHTADTLVATIVAIAMFVVLWRAHRRGAALFIAGTLAVAAFSTAVLKDLIVRPRPPAALAALPIPSTSSFPSGHTVTGLVLYGGLAVVLLMEFGTTRRYLTAAAVLAVFSALIGVSRVYLGVHWPTDVIGGWLLGGAWLAASTGLWIAMRSWLAARERLDAPDGAGPPPTRGAAEA